jgi:hypothetical protein
LLEYFEKLSTVDKLPTLDTLLEKATLLTDRYVSQAAPVHSLSAVEAASDDYENKVPNGTPWVGPVRSATSPQSTDPDFDDLPELVDITEPEPPVETPETAKKADDTPKHHEEKSGFTGDRVLRNSQLFMMDMGWWIEMAHAVPEGDIGRVWEIMKVRIRKTLLVEQG